jgi:hypothetical protein
VDGGMILMDAVGEIQAEDVDPGQEQAAEHGGTGARRSDGCDDLGAPVASLHVASFRVAVGLLSLERIGGGEPAVTRSVRSVVELIHTTPPCR